MGKIVQERSKNDGAGLLLHKRKDGGAQWLYRYTFHKSPSRNEFGSVERCFFKKARECANQWRSVLREGHAPIKERNKQKREAMRNLHYVKDIALDTSESRKAELKNDAKDGNLFYI